MKLYRIISLETFLDIIVNKRERYVRPATWEDTFEGYLFSKLKNSADRKRIVEYWYHEVCSNNCQNVIINMMHLDGSKYVYGQCWSELSESDALWRIYSYGNHSIQIQTSEEDLEKLLTERNIKGTIRKIEYDITSEKDLLEKQLLQSAQEGYAYTPFLHKRKAFEHEKEHRVLIYDTKCEGVSKFKTYAANSNFAQNIKGKNLDDDSIVDLIIKNIDEFKSQDEVPGNFYIENINLDQYIRKITINPLAEEWYVKLIQDICSDYKLPLCEKSNLYKGI